MADDLDNAFAALRIFLSKKYPGDDLDILSLRLRSGRRLVLPASYHAAQDLRRSATHSADFRTVNWFGRVYRFTQTQAAIVALLWEAREADAPDVSQAKLLETAGSESGRLIDLFRRSEAWGVVVVPGDSAGTYRLGDEPDDVINTA
jgi:hypothetical protein